MTGRLTKRTGMSQQRTLRLPVLPAPTVPAATGRILNTDRRSLTQGTMITRIPPQLTRRRKMRRTNLSVNMAWTVTVKILSTEKITNTPGTLSLNVQLK